MAIFNKEYIRNYNQKVKPLNESITSFLILSITSIITFIAALWLAISIENKKEEDFNKLLEKYPLIKKYIIELIKKCQDILLKTTKIKYVEYIPDPIFSKDGRNLAIHRYNTKIDESNNKAEWKNCIFAMDPIKFLKSSPSQFKKYIVFEDGGFYLSDEYHKLKEIDKEKYNNLEKIHKNLIEKINEDIKSMNSSINKLNKELKNQPNGNIIKLESVFDDSDLEEEIGFPRNWVDLSINMNNIVETDDIKKKVLEFKKKYFI